MRQRGGGGGKKKNATVLYYLWHSHHPFWDWDSNISRSQEVSSGFACPSLVLRNENESETTSWFAPPNCVIANRVLKIVISLVFFPSFDTFRFCFCFGRSHECDRRNLSSNVSPLFFLTFTDMSTDLWDFSEGNRHVSSPTAQFVSAGCRQTVSAMIGGRRQVTRHT